MKIIALSGWKGAGKDVVGSKLVEEYGFTRIAFADKLKDHVSHIHNIPRYYFEERLLKEAPLLHLKATPKDPFAKMLIDYMQGELASHKGELYWTPRALLILEASCKRAITPTYWVDQTLNNLPEGSYVITDIRYQLEAAALLEKFPEAKIIRVNRATKSASTDSSETDLDNYNFDFSIDNSGSYENTYEQLKIIVDKLF